MAQFDLEETVEMVRGALAQEPEPGDGTGVQSLLHRLRPADLAEVMEALDRSEALALLLRLDDETAGDVLTHISDPRRSQLLASAPPDRLADFLEELPTDDAVEAIEDASEERAEEILSAMLPEEAQEVREQLLYDENTAGRLMTDRFVRIEPHRTIGEALDSLRREAPEAEELSYFYVVDEGRLAGVLSLRDLVLAPTDALVRERMIPEPITATVDTDQEEVARLISRYDLLALPILDRDGDMVGIVTVDDIVDVLVEEATEDVLKQAAVGDTDTPYLAAPVTATVRQRFPWLLMLFVAGTLTGSVMRIFGDQLEAHVALAVYIPLLIGTGGNAGSQTVSTITRSLATGEVRLRDWSRVLAREIATGALLGFLIGLVAFGRALTWHGGLAIALTVALTVVAIVLWATMVGAVLPIAAKRLGGDPAVMSAPFITTLVDATGLVIYFLIARALLV